MPTTTTSCDDDLRTDSSRALVTTIPYKDGLQRGAGRWQLILAMMGVKFSLLFCSDCCIWEHNWTKDHQSVFLYLKHQPSVVYLNQHSTSLNLIYLTSRYPTVNSIPGQDTHRTLRWTFLRTALSHFTTLPSQLWVECDLELMNSANIEAMVQEGMTISSSARAVDFGEKIWHQK